MTIENLIQHLGYPIVLLLVVSESMGVPLPGETALLIASAMAGATTTLNLRGVIAAGALGAIIGGNIGYWLGRWGGRPLLERIDRHLPRKLTHVPRAERFLEQHGGIAIFFDRFVAFLRVFAALLAGTLHMRYLTFLICTVAGSLLWATAISLLGHTFGRNLPLIEKIMREVGWALLALIIICIGYFAWRHFAKQHR